jgi:hypothetical protein
LNLNFEPTNNLFVLSYALLCGMVLVESILLVRALRETVGYLRSLDHISRRREWATLPPGTKLPRLPGKVLGNGTFRMAQLRGAHSILLFVSAAPVSSPSYLQLHPVVHALWHKVERRVFLVCNGASELCRELIEERVPTFPLEQVIVDKAGRFSRRMRINRTPEAVELDEHGRIARYGRPGSEGEIGVS